MAYDPALLALLPESRLGAVESLTPITMGQSGAGVYAVDTPRGAYVLRVQSRAADGGAFARQLRVLQRAAAAGVAPELVHVDEAARAVVSVRVQGMPLAAAVMDPSARPRVLASAVDRLRVVHSLDSSDLAE